jgi:hypothetical protein
MPAFASALVAELAYVYSMYTTRWLSLLVLVGCSAPSKQDSARAFEAMTTAATTAQSTAVANARQHLAAVPAALVIQFDGACPGGGTMHVAGSYDGPGTGNAAAFDLDMTFAQCTSALGDTVDGDVTWTSTASAATGFSETMTGDIAVHGRNVSAACDFDVTLAVNLAQISYGGTMCGYDVQALLTL